MLLGTITFQFLAFKRYLLVWRRGRVARLALFFYMWVPGLELRASGLAAGTFTC